MIDRLWSKQNVRQSLFGLYMLNIALMDMNWLIYEIRKKWKLIQQLKWFVLSNIWTTAQTFHNTTIRFRNVNHNRWRDVDKRWTSSSTKFTVVIQSRNCFEIASN